MSTRFGILAEVSKERDAQDAEHGGPEADDKHSEAEWAVIMARHFGLAFGDRAEIDPLRFRRQMVRVAALAVAVLESFDRKRQAGVNSEKFKEY